MLYIYIHIYSIFFYFYLNEAKAQRQIGRAFVEQRDALAERIRWFFRQRQTEQTRSDGFFFHETPTARGDFIFFLFEMKKAIFRQCKAKSGTMRLYIDESTLKFTKAHKKSDTSSRLEKSLNFQMSTKVSRFVYFLRFCWFPYE